MGLLRFRLFSGTFGPFRACFLRTGSSFHRFLENRSRAIVTGKSPQKKVNVYTQYSALGLQFATGIFLFTYAGHWCDDHWGTNPWGVLIGAGLGFAGSSVWLYYRVYPSE